MKNLTDVNNRVKISSKHSYQSPGLACRGAAESAEQGRGKWSVCTEDLQEEPFLVEMVPRVKNFQREG